jgi:hypothetical protein
MRSDPRMHAMRFFLVAALLFAVPAWAHHGTSAYDFTKTITLNGTATSFDWGNPHCLLHLDVKASSGAVERWTLELAPPTAMSRKGWDKGSIKPGDEVTIDAHPAKNGIPLGISSSTSYVLKTVVNGKQLPSR